MTVELGDVEAERLAVIIEDTVLDVVYLDANTSWCRRCEKEVPNAHAEYHRSGEMCD